MKDKILLSLLAIALGILISLVPPVWVLELLYTPWWNWTWWCNAALRVVAAQLVAVLLLRRLRGAVAPLAWLGLACILGVLFLEAASVRFEEKPLQLQGLLLNLGVALLALKEIRKDRRTLEVFSGQPYGQGEKHAQDHRDIVKGRL